MNFLYQLLYKTNGASGVLWQDESLLFIDIRSDAAIVCWWYKSEEQLRIILKEFKSLLFMYGLNFLETISKPTTEAVPTEEMGQYLYQNHQKLYKEYSLKLQTQGKSAEEVIEIINQTM